MDKKDFLEKRKALQKKIIEVQHELKDLEQQYIDSSDLKRFKVVLLSLLPRTLLPDLGGADDDVACRIQDRNFNS